jgi:prepilin-type N-terminal cleavage/methylation domain-containing protein/prepilin-type processing-associated H-X9-DG protein
MPRRRGAKRGFTLVELLVVIGIIALLIAILLPVLGRAREAGNRVKCLSNLRNMVQAAYLHAQEHQGYMPFAGHPAPSAQGVRASSIGLGDTNRVRYIYFDDGDIGFRPLPLSVALGSYMGVTMPNFRQSSDFVEVLKRDELRRHFICPSESTRTIRPTDYSIQDGGDDWSHKAGPEYMSYIFNAWVLCLCPAPEGGMSPAGKITRVRQPSEVFLFADGNSTGLGQCGYGVEAAATNSDTLYDYWRHFDGGSSPWHQLDHARHRNKLNVAYVDGHAETLELPNRNNPGDLDRIGLTRGVTFE